MKHSTFLLRRAREHEMDELEYLLRQERKAFELKKWKKIDSAPKDRWIMVRDETGKEFGVNWRDDLEIPGFCNYENCRKIITNLIFWKDLD